MYWSIFMMMGCYKGMMNKRILVYLPHARAVLVLPEVVKWKIYILDVPWNMHQSSSRFLINVNNLTQIA